MPNTAQANWDKAKGEVVDRDEADVLSRLTGEDVVSSGKDANISVTVSDLKPSRAQFNDRSTRLAKQKETLGTPEQRRKKKALDDKNRELPADEKATGMIRNFDEAKKKPQSERSAHLKTKRAVITADARDLEGAVTSGQAKGALGKRRIGSGKHLV